MKKSLIVTWIANNDYPIFRAWLEKYHTWFEEIIICWDLAFRFPFYNAFIQQSLSHLNNIKFLDPPPRELGVDDWRNVATNHLVNNSSGDWLVSIEQDWFAKDWPQLLAKIEAAMQTSDMVGWLNPTNVPYIHPAFWFIKRELLEKTTRDFGPHSEISGCDHFGMVTYEAQQLEAKITPVQELGFATEVSTPELTDTFHLGGVNQNYLDFDELFKAGQVHRSSIFRVYNHWSMLAPVRQSPEFLRKCQEVDTYLKSLHPEIDPATNGWGQFFNV